MASFTSLSPKYAAAPTSLSLEPATTARFIRLLAAPPHLRVAHERAVNTNYTAWWRELKIGEVFKDLAEVECQEEVHSPLGVTQKD